MTGGVVGVIGMIGGGVAGPAGALFAAMLSGVARDGAGGEVGTGGIFDMMVEARVVRVVIAVLTLVREEGAVCSAAT